MTEWLLLRVAREPGEPWSWAAVDATGQMLVAPNDSRGTTLLGAAAGRRVALLLPGTDVALLSATLPAGNEAKLLPLVPFALEDQVSQDIELLHFALGPRDALTGTTAVAVVERALLQGWLDHAGELGLSPQAAYAESELVPAFPGQITMVLAGEQLILRGDNARTAVLPAADPQLALEMFLGQDAGNASAGLPSVHLAVYSGATEWQKHSRQVEALRDRVATLKVQLSTGGMLALAARALPQSGAINLLQGVFRPRSAATNQWKKWRLVAMLAGALLLLHLLADGWQLRQLRKAERALDDSIAQVYATAFPGQPAGGDARRRMEQRLSGSSGDANQPGELMHVLAALSAARQNVPVVQLESLGFHRGAAQMKLAAPDAITLEQFGKALQGGGYSAQVTSGATSGTGYEGQIEAKSLGSRAASSTGVTP
jgi:general secretion pathway protein L